MSQQIEYMVAVGFAGPVDVHNGSCGNFEYIVKAFIDDGWRPIGGMTCLKNTVTDSGGYRFYQAMIRE